MGDEMARVSGTTNRPYRRFTVPEDDVYRVEAGEITRVYQDTGHAVMVQAGEMWFTVPDSTWTVIEWDSEDLP